MVIDCDRCEVRGAACGDCVIGVLLGVPDVPARADAGRTSGPVPSGAAGVQFDAPERRALELLAEGGLIPRLRLVAAPEREGWRESDGAEGIRDVV